MSRPYREEVDLRLDRHSVAAGDDATAHDEVIQVDGRRPVSLVIAQNDLSGYLAPIHSRRATWVARRARRGDPIAVVAQQWDAPRLIIAEDLELSAVGDSMFFEYLAQVDPDEIVSRLAGGGH
mgnify:CR=1 FL=1